MSRVFVALLLLCAAVNAAAEAPRSIMLERMRACAAEALGVPEPDTLPNVVIADDSYFVQMALVFGLEPDTVALHLPLPRVIVIPMTVANWPREKVQEVFAHEIAHDVQHSVRLRSQGIELEALARLEEGARWAQAWWWGCRGPGK